MNLEQFNRILRSAMLLPILALLGMAAALYWQMHEANSTVALIEQADQRIAQALILDRLMLDEETALRGYEITDDPSFLTSFTDARARLVENLNQLDAIQGTAERATLLRDTRAAIVAWERDSATPVIAILQSGNHLSDHSGHAQSERQLQLIHSDIASMEHLPEHRRAERIALWQEQVHRMAIVLGVLAVTIGLAIAFFMRDRLHEVSAAYQRTLEILRIRSDEIFRSEQNLRTTLASIGDGVITCDADGCVLTMNTVAQELTGWKERDARTLPLERVFDIVNETTRELVENPVAKVKRLNRVVGLANHTILRRRDGTEIQIDDSGAPIRDQNGFMAGVVLVFRDITLQKKSQEALIANEKLAVAGRLAATIAHEIHNPLDSVSNLLYLMSGPSTPEESTHFLAMAKQELDRVTQISRAMLGLYRESREPVSIDLKEMLESLLLLMERRFQDLGVTLEADLPAGLVVHGFPAELRQVFTNLLTNAAEAAGNGGHVVLRAEPAPTGHDRNGDPTEAGAIVSVADTGPGIPAEVLTQLFQPFFTTKGEHGTGLGLWVCRGILTKHGGSIDVHSDTASETHGTRMSVFLATDPVIHPAAS